MEALIIFVLFAVVSTIFQTIKEGNSRSQRQAEALSRQNNRNVPPTVRQEKVLGKKSYNSTDGKIMKTSIVMQKTAVDNKLDMYGEGAQTEGIERDIFDRRSSAAEAEIKESHISGIELDDLQRSIIMAEILGKPKALRKY